MMLLINGPSLLYEIGVYTLNEKLSSLSNTYFLCLGCLIHCHSNLLPICVPDEEYYRNAHTNATYLHELYDTIYY